MSAGPSRRLEEPRLMDAEQCKQRAADCAANAMVAADATVSQEFLRLAAQWRAMAVRTIVLDAEDGLDLSPRASVLGAPQTSSVETRREQSE